MHEAFNYRLFVHKKISDHISCDIFSLYSVAFSEREPVGDGGGGEEGRDEDGQEHIRLHPGEHAGDRVRGAGGGGGDAGGAGACGDGTGNGHNFVDANDAGGDVEMENKTSKTKILRFLINFVQKFLETL